MKSEILQRCQCSGQSWSTRDFHQVLCMPLPLCSHLSTLILSRFCSNWFYVSALHSVLLCSFPVIFYTNLYNRNLFPPLPLSCKFPSHISIDKTELMKKRLHNLKKVLISSLDQFPLFISCFQEFP